MKITSLFLLVAFMLAAGTVANAALNVYGVSGLIETPDDSVVPPKSVELTAHYISDVDRSDVDITTYGAAFGLIPKLEISAVAVDPSGGPRYVPEYEVAPAFDEGSTDSTKVLLNAKYQILGEAVDRPSVTIGVVDVAKKLKDYGGDIDKISAFVVVGKNISPLAEGFSGRVSKPVRGTLGIGTGLYKGVFGGLSWSMAPRFDVVAEYLTKGIRQKSTLNAAVRFTPAAPVSIQVGTHAFKSFYAGASFNLAVY